ncbi:hypothetical protein PHAVU_011G007701 [Phaseolus vulgaris]|uniref:Uncharacterized protein n=1 Tax=Phaseolus vulgaris TaxID=3885 RepID=V7ADQ0_PHAVU|nr:hypothetical protein PHAVU_011G007700g [Phaseolus vulgaris]ESW03360.1 hypothetical protein PHAVU_011G007700g [Phaseolus vulgaris]
MASKTNICLLLFLSFIFIFSAKTISATNNLALASASEQNAGSGEMSESRKLLGTGREQRPKCKGKKSTQDHSKDKPQCHNYL